MKFLFVITLLATTHAAIPRPAFGRVVEAVLEIEETQWSPDPSLEAVPALTVNGTIPGPVLRFREGDIAHILVRNHLRRQETSIHWHGILLPNKQDGVPHVTTPPIAPGGEHLFTFTLRHAGTYWYHSHTGLQEQRGTYGAIVVEPRQSEPASRDVVAVLSDWTRESPERVMRALKRGTSWYALKKGTIQSLSGAIREGALTDFLDRERSRMPAMDISDVAYDRFLVNGAPRHDVDARPGETVRLRVVNAAASTYFYLSSAAGPLRIVAADGPAVHPIAVNKLLMGMAETYDLLVKVPGPGRWEIRATAQDGSGSASIWLGNGPQEHPAPPVPAPDLYSMDAHLMAAMEDEELSSTRDEDALREEAARPLSPYRRLRALDLEPLPQGPRREVELRLTGDMERYVWSFNNLTAAEDGVIRVRAGEVLRLVLVNDTMMHHPLHLHGHFFRIVDDEESGARPDAALKHTLDVPPMGKRIIEFGADAPGDWLFHCHLLYHMHAGMTRIFSYQVPDQAPHMPHLGEHGAHHFHFTLEGSVQTHMTEGTLMLMGIRNDFLAEWEAGYDVTDIKEGDRLELEYEVDVGWRHVFTPNFSSRIMLRLSGEEDTDLARGVAGVAYRLPYLIESFIEADSEGELRAGLGKTLQVTDRLSLFAEVEYDTGSQWEASAGALWTLTPSLSLITQAHSSHGFGAGIAFAF